MDYNFRGYYEGSNGILGGRRGLKTLRPHAVSVPGIMYVENVQLALYEETKDVLIHSKK